PSATATATHTPTATPTATATATHTPTGTPSATPTCAPGGQITTLFASNNNGSNGGAVYFDLTVAANPISITSLDLNTASTSPFSNMRSEEHTSELQSLAYLVCRLLLEKKKDS